jgi:hypothetical protein
VPAPRVDEPGSEGQHILAVVLHPRDANLIAIPEPKK